MKTMVAARKRDMVRSQGTTSNPAIRRLTILRDRAQAFNAANREQRPFVNRLVPELAVELAVVDGFADVRRLQFGGPFEIGDRAGHAEDFVVGSGREAELGHVGAELN